MHEIIYTPDNLKYIASQKHKENTEFRKFLTHFNESDTDKRVQTINNRIEPLIDCRKCANCCKHLDVAVSEEEATILSQKTITDFEEFKSSTLKFDAIHQTFYINTKPCSFLQENNKCAVYGCHPQGCRDFPNLNKTGFKFRYRRIMDYYGLCPIVYNVVELLKTEVGFRY